MVPGDLERSLHFTGVLLIQSLGGGAFIAAYIYIYIYIYTYVFVANRRKHPNINIPHRPLNPKVLVVIKALDICTAVVLRSYGTAPP